ncbi:dihydropteroate synthase [Radicibacter daui]|uniref:dihydropteroate synthase n=1 Tax=Radicibacter daui TaxID=3064829 RepID=UPI004046F744
MQILGHIRTALAQGARVYLRPVGLLPPGVGGPALRMVAPGPAFAAAEIILRRAGRIERHTVTALALRELIAPEIPALRLLLDRLESRRAPIPGVPSDRPSVMGIVNVTPDSFSDGGDSFEIKAAIARGEALREAGADILDIGGESTRPGADVVSLAEELRRVVPVVEALAERGAIVSVDTRHAGVMRQAVAAGAAIVNDISALEGDPESMDAMAACDVPVVLMHMQGQPGSMQENPVYEAAALDVYDYLDARIAACERAGIARARLVLDPGIGFGKTLAHNLDILAHSSLYATLGLPVLIGLSRKRFIAAISRGEAPKDRLAGSLAAGLETLAQGAAILRVHDVAATVQGLKVARAIAGGARGEAGVSARLDGMGETIGRIYPGGMDQ